MLDCKGKCRLWEVLELLGICIYTIKYAPQFLELHVVLRPTCWNFPWVDASKAIVKNKETRWKPTAAFPDLILCFQLIPQQSPDIDFFFKKALHCLWSETLPFLHLLFLLRASFNPLLISLAFLFLTVSQSLPNFLSIPLVIPSSHLILWCPLFLLPSIFPSIRDFSNESALRIRWPKYWSFSFSISPSNEYSGLISFRMDWLDLLAVQGTLKSDYE